MNRRLLLRCLFVVVWVSDLARFLLDRIAEDTKAALGPRAYDIEADWEDMAPRSVVAGPPYADYVDHFTPARVLADLAAKRRTIRLHRDDREHYCPTDAGSEYFNYNHGWAEADESPQICPTLKLLAEPYRSHPSFDASWLLP